MNLDVQHRPVVHPEDEAQVSSSPVKDSAAFLLRRDLAKSSVRVASRTGDEK